MDQGDDSTLLASRSLLMCVDPNTFWVASGDTHKIIWESGRSGTYPLGEERENLWVEGREWVEGNGT
jgi:hypothetical protein